MYLHPPPTSSMSHHSLRLHTLNIILQVSQSLKLIKIFLSCLQLIILTKQSYIFIMTNHMCVASK